MAKKSFKIAPSPEALLYANQLKAAASMGRVFKKMETPKAMQTGNKVPTLKKTPSLPLI